MKWSSAGGVPVAPLKVTGETRNRRGTEVHFWPRSRPSSWLSTTLEILAKQFASSFPEPRRQD